jgi:type I restriction enzyme M protein
MVDRTHRDLTDDDIDAIASSYRRWRAQDGSYVDRAGFCRAVAIDKIRAHHYALVPGRYVGFAERPSVAPLDRLRLLADLREIEEQLEMVESLSHSAIQTIRQVMRG